MSTANEIPAFYFVSAHGGAGATTLATVIRPGADSGSQWPPHDDDYVYLVCTATVRGVDMAHQMATEYKDQKGNHLLGLVVVSHNAGKPPKAVLAKIKTVRALLPVFEMSFVKDFVEKPLEELPVWEPTRDQPQQKFRRTKSPIPPPIAELGEALSKHFVERYTSPSNDSLPIEKETQND